jgi:hypothetical protein
MANNKKSFIFYCDWKETFSALPLEKAGLLINHLLAYVNDENPQTDDILINAVFANIKQTLKRDLKKYDLIREKRINAGKASAEAKKQNSTSVNTCQQVNPVNDNVNVNVNVNDKELKENPIKENEGGISMRINNINYDLGLIRSKSGAINFIRTSLQLNDIENKKKIIEKINLIPSADFNKDIINALVRIKGIIEEVLKGE